MDAFSGGSVALFFIGLFVFVGIILLTDDGSWERKKK